MLCYTILRARAHRARGRGPRACLAILRGTISLCIDICVYRYVDISIYYCLFLVYVICICMCVYIYIYTYTYIYIYIYIHILRGTEGVPRKGV